ncbi:deoxyribose-phosphate aldolase [Ignisphaera aggregans DSM 17230]|uniref:Deoxyribose-phosphate aldolase n=1 Tax=Ignisphaera aggregans (strain DSM 17230 / JCM 13409 / AQ1.S1) TaxID=583356 RepID=E0SNU4_IGNAA|nr:deoxyribose-phosphate aldolase [Ignisphaera aggregans DSM 17230]
MVITINDMIYEFIKRFSEKQFAELIDNTLLKQDVSLDIVKRYVEDTRIYGFKNLFLSPYHAKFVLRNRLSEDISIGSVVGFPMGFQTIKAKLSEAEELLSLGVKEIDMVMNLQAFRDKEYQYVEEEISQMRDIVKSYGAILKVIIETPLLADEEKIRATEIVISGGADFVKTATGFFGATSIHDIELLARVARGRIKIKAAGGIRHAIEAIIMIFLGAERIGTSSAVQIFNEFKNLRNSIR